MKKVLLPLAVLVLSATAYNATAASGNVKFTGEIVQSTCKVVDKDQNKEVYLGKYPTSAFPTSGSTSGAKAFDISLEKCEPGNYTLRFDGNTPAGHPELLAVTGGANGVGVEILDNNGSTLPISQEVATPATVSVAADGDNPGSATFNLRARYKSFQDAVTAGQANSNATFTIEYK
ncbi:Type-1A pilin [Serratia quinivorans]|uniref:fimbrial protein n=1 Tax=Serratia TaxID=613 RepID=UPI002179F39C|nr:fimbrial protein [Serratia quinivorans]CAI0758095.1 Type-1A pilin [Serratia quinivorans]CAI0770759.1 Type-1A pilin [Serratia quinivorans]CAI0810974.1 Type-1A pilin [Serratia quinivorans]CAI0926990.1 Type-1A pilin [Serratia quinivorans]CAI0944334.1 Type-1A pilin [Serratia quinivorans]